MPRRPSGPIVPLVAVIAAVAALLVGLTAVAGPAAAATPSTPGAFVGLTPARVLDTRSGVGAPAAPVTPGRAVELTVAGAGGVPASGVAAVVLTLTVTNTRAGGYLSAYPAGGAAPVASVVNWNTGQTVAGQATVTVGTGGVVDLLVQAGRPVDLVADVSGYVVAGTPTAAGAYVARTPTRLLDTRSGVGARRARVQSGQTLQVPLAGRGGLPAAAQLSAVVATLTVVRPGTAGYLSVWGGGRRPEVSALNFAAGQTVANQVTVPIGTDGAVDVFAQGGLLDAVLDVTGYVIAGTATEPGTYVPLAPRRILDTRRTGNPPPREVVPAQVSGLGGVPTTGVASVVANLTVTNTTSSGYLAATPFDVPGSGTVNSNLNWATGRTVANQATVALGSQGRIGLLIGAATSPTVVLDVFGYYLPAPPATPDAVSATADRTSVDLQWTSPAGAPVTFVVRRAVGTTAPTSPTEGTAVDSDVLGTPGRFRLTDTGLTPSTTYSYAVFAADAVPNYSAPGTTTITTQAPDTTPPGADTGLAATPQVTSVTLTWTPPSDADYRTSVVRYAAGSTAPASPTDGTGVAGSFTDAAFVAGLSSATTYSFTVFARDDSGNVSPTGPSITVTTVGTTDLAGTTTPLPPGGLDPQKGLLDTDCPTVGHCVALSWYYDETAARHGLLMITVAGDAGPVSYPVPLPGTVGGFDHPSAAVSCTGDTDCAIVGSYPDATSGDRVAFTGTWNGTAASTSALPDASVAPAAVDCPAAGSCVAVGTRTDGAAGSPWVARLAAGAWSEVPVTGVTDTGLGSVSCASTTSCAAVGGGATGDGAPAVVAATTTGTAWTAARATLPSGATGWSAFGPVTCPEAGTCVVAGRDVLSGSPTRFGPALVTWRGGTWSTEVLPGTPSTDQFDPAQVACGGGRCAVLIGNGSGSTVLTRPVAGGTWTVTFASTLPAGARTDTSSGLTGIACDGTGRCAGVGGWADSSGYSRGFVAAFSTRQNSATSVEPSVRAALGGTNLGSPACTADGHCIAGADYLASTENSWLATFTIAGG